MRPSRQRAENPRQAPLVDLVAMETTDRLSRSGLVAFRWRRKVSGQTKAAVIDKLRDLHTQLDKGVTPRPTTPTTLAGKPRRTGSRTA
jgi:hypothetical protein